MAGVLIAGAGLPKQTVRSATIEDRELRRKGYPSETDMEAIYAVFDVEPDPFYNDWHWDFARLVGRRGGFRSPQPFAVRLIDVLNIHRL
jgi:hypothetical protein